MTSHQESPKAQLWQARIAEQKTSGLTKSAFCKEKGLSRFQFDYWVKRFKSKGIGRAKAIARPSAFIKAEVLPPPRPVSVSTLDPKWVAEFILHLQGGLR